MSSRSAYHSPTLSVTCSVLAQKSLRRQRGKQGMRRAGKASIGGGWHRVQTTASALEHVLVECCRVLRWWRAAPVEALADLRRDVGEAECVLHRLLRPLVVCRRSLRQARTSVCGLVGTFAKASRPVTTVTSSNNTARPLLYVTCQQHYTADAVKQTVTGIAQRHASGAAWCGLTCVICCSASEQPSPAHHVASVVARHLEVRQAVTETDVNALILLKRRFCSVAGAVGAFLCHPLQYPTGHAVG